MNSGCVVRLEGTEGRSREKISADSSWRMDEDHVSVGWATAKGGRRAPNR